MSVCRRGSCSVQGIGYLGKDPSILLTFLGQSHFSHVKGQIHRLKTMEILILMSGMDILRDIAVHLLLCYSTIP